jgi:hypothetical protein
LHGTILLQMKEMIFMRYFQAIVLLALFSFLATPASAQRDAYTSSARAAYRTPIANSEINHKKNKKAATKVHARKTRKLKTKDPKAARVRRSSLHF